MNTPTLLTFLPWFLQIGQKAPAQRLIVNYILPKALDHLGLAYSFYFECEMLKPSPYYEALQERLMGSLDD